MHRTTTTATLLVTVAVSALSGCTTVQRPPTSGTPAAPSQPSVPRPSGPAEPEVVQAPAREALALIGPSPSPDPTPAAARSAPPSTPRQASPAPRAPRPGQDPRSAHHAPRRPHSDAAPAAPERAGPPVPDVSKSLPREVQGNPDVCALGRKYGGWPADSPESRICDQTYGR
ncbi:hypothetical protein [Streptomyces sp. NPDC093568]|uniref:hypothetical protein n=1 Tax=Streptomyces sp. NPDC093568 TaxID=3366041 RepID=UPI0037F68B41